MLEVQSSAVLSSSTTRRVDTLCVAMLSAHWSLAISLLSRQTLRCREGDGGAEREIERENRREREVHRAMQKREETRSGNQKGFVEPTDGYVLFFLRPSSDRLFLPQIFPPFPLFSCARVLYLHAGSLCSALAFQARSHRHWLGGAAAAG